jgi:BirA family biotin operon repressor/biotin-[acetyl-CoA-carboxylase] ligase
LKVELLDNQAINSQLAGYWRVSIIDEIPSTQTGIKKLNPKHGELLATEFQSAGRGRLDRTFEATRSTALLFSFYLKPKRDKSDWGFVSLLAGAAMVSTINKLTNSKKYSCKWPNDILSGDKKVGGLLGEVFEDGIIMGIGINVTMSADQLPVENASSILLESGEVINRNALLVEFCKEFKNRFEQWDSGSDLQNFYLVNCQTIGKEVKAIKPDGEISGKASGISEKGALLLESGVEVTVGDLVHLKG